MHRKTIIQVTPHFPPSIGGMETFVYQLSKQLYNKDYNVMIITAGKKADERLISSKHFGIKYLKCFEIFNTRIIFNLFWNLLRLPKNSIIHLHVAHMYTPEITYIAARIRKIPYLVQIHGILDSRSKLRFILKFYRRIILRRVLENAEIIVVPTLDYRHYISRECNISKSKIKVIPNGIDLHLQKHFNKKITKPIKLLFVGRLVDDKNPLLLLEIIKRLEQMGIPTKLNVVGEGKLRNQLEAEISRSQLQRIVCVSNFLDKLQLKKIYLSSDILLVTSRYETFGYVIVEAMENGLPVIANNIPGVRNIIKHNYSGILVANDVSSYAKAISELSKNSILYNSIKINELREVKKYDWKYVVNSFEKIYIRT